MEIQTISEPRKNTALILAHVPVVIEPKVSIQYWANEINAATEEENEAIRHKGLVLIAAKKALLRHGLWEKLFKQHQHDADAPVRFSITTARMYMAIAKHPRLSNPNLGLCLPPSMTAQYQLTLMPDERLSQLIDAGAITADLTKAQAMALRLVDSSLLPYRMQWEKPRKHPIHKQCFAITSRQRSYASIINSMENAQAMLFRYATEVSEAIQSGVLWLPPFTHLSAIPAKPIKKPKHRCECGDVHEDQR